MDPLRITTLHVQAGMLSSCEHLKILWSVIAFVFVDVMHLFAVDQIATDLLFRHQSGPLYMATLTSAGMPWAQGQDITARREELPTKPFVMPFSSQMVVVDELIPFPRLIEGVWNRLTTAARAKWLRMKTEHMRPSMIADVLGPELVDLFTTAAGTQRSEIVRASINTLATHA